MPDTVIRGGSVVDGTGAAPRTADVGIRAGSAVHTPTGAPATRLDDEDAGERPGRPLRSGQGGAR